MHSSKLIYFPYIDLPKNSWTIKSVLYWDQVGIIVPPDFAKKPKQYQAFSLDLLKSDLVEQVFPDNYTWRLKNFNKGFLKLIDQPKFHLKARQRNFQNGSWSRIHVQKFGQELMYYLEELNIAKRKDWSWFRVETKTANLMMLYLATVVSKVGGFTPATDSVNNLDTSIQQKGFSLKLNETRQKLLNKLIPYPIAPDLTKIRKFKDRFHEELTSFRILLESTAYDLTSIRSKKEQSQRLDLKVAEINDRREKILREMDQRKFGQIAFGTICGVTGAIVSYSQDNSSLAIFSLANALYSAFQGYEKNTSLTKDYAYLALIDKKLK